METSKIEKSKNKFYYIQISVVCCDMYEEYSWSEGSVAYLDIKTNEKKDLKNISDKMWDEFSTERSSDWHMNRNSQITIGLFENNTLGILYSDLNDFTNVKVIDGILDTVNIKFNSLNNNDYNVFKDEIGYESDDDSDIEDINE
jgi:hypothetical protein